MVNIKTDKAEKMKIFLLYIYSLITSCVVSLYTYRMMSLDTDGTSSYVNVLRKLVRQINHLEPFETLHGNMHGAVYPIFLAHLEKWLYDFSGGGYRLYSRTIWYCVIYILGAGRFSHIAVLLLAYYDT